MRHRSALTPSRITVAAAAAVIGASSLVLREIGKEAACRERAPHQYYVDFFFLFAAVADIHPPPPADTSVVEQKMNLVGVLAHSDFIAKPLHLRFVGYVGDVRGDA